MIELDSPTLLITQAMIQWLLAILLMIERGKEPGIKYWIASLLLHGLANFLLYMRPLLHPFGAIIFYNACVTVAFSFGHFAFGRIFFTKIPVWQLVLPFVITTLLMGVYIDDIATRVTYASLVVSAQLFFITYTLYLSQDFGDAHLKKWLMCTMGLFGLGFLMRAFLSYWYPDFCTQLHGTSLIQASFIMVGIIYSVLSTLIILLVKLERLNNELFIQASRDSLTGLFNRRAFFSQADQLLKNESFPISIAMIDVDDFKKVNDKYEHAMGDTVLKLCAKSFQRVIRQRGVIGRLGGEEFVVMLPEMDANQAKQFAEALRLSIQQTLFAPNITVSVSIGVTTTKKHVGIDSLLHRADEALYRAKFLGKNQVIYSDKAEEFKSVKQHHSLTVE